MTEVNTTLKERGNKYGTFADNARVTQSLMDVLATGANFNKLSPAHLEAFHMIFHKISRAVNGDAWYNDNPHDIAGYAKLLEEVINEHNKDIK